MDKAWKALKHNFIRFYVYKIWGGDPINQAAADNESLQKLDFQFLNAIRDVERDMLTGRNTLLREVFDFFMDYEIKINETKTIEEKYQEIKERKILFSEKANLLINDLGNRIAEGKSKFYPMQKVLVHHLIKPVRTLKEAFLRMRCTQY